LNQAGSSGTCSTSAARGPSRTGAWSAGSKSADTAAWSSLHHPCIYAAKNSAALGSQHVHIGNRQVITGNRQIQVVLQGQTNRILERQVQLAITDQLVQ